MRCRVVITASRGLPFRGRLRERAQFSTSRATRQVWLPLRGVIALHSGCEHRGSRSPGRGRQRPRPARGPTERRQRLRPRRRQPASRPRRGPGRCLGVFSRARDGGPGTADRRADRRAAAAPERRPHAGGRSGELLRDAGARHALPRLGKRSSRTPRGGRRLRCAAPHAQGARRSRRAGAADRRLVHPSAAPADAHTDRSGRSDPRPRRGGDARRR